MVAYVKKWRADLYAQRFLEHLAELESQSRKARARSVRVARQAGKRHAANEAIAITMNADPNATGSRGFTL